MSYSWETAQTHMNDCYVLPHVRIPLQCTKQTPLLQFPRITQCFSIVFFKGKNIQTISLKTPGSGAACCLFYTPKTAPPAHTETHQDMGNRPQTRICSVFQEPQTRKPALLLVGILGLATAKSQAVPWVPTKHNRSKLCHQESEVDEN